MAVLLRTGQARCDSRCYGADHPRCTCKVCGGLMHGLGQHAAIQMVSKVLERLTEDEIEETQKPRRKTDPQIIVLTGRIDRHIVGRLRAPYRVRKQIANGQLELPLMGAATETTRFRRLRSS
jgi:hypothetical protein